MQRHHLQRLFCGASNPVWKKRGREENVEFSFLSEVNVYTIHYISEFMIGLLMVSSFIHPNHGYFTRCTRNRAADISKTITKLRMYQSDLHFSQYYFFVVSNCDNTTNCDCIVSDLNIPGPG